LGLILTFWDCAHWPICSALGQVTRSNDYEEGRKGGKQESPETDSLDDQVQMVPVRGREEGRRTIDLHKLDTYKMRTFSRSSKASRADFGEFWSKSLACLEKKVGKKKIRVTLRAFRLTGVK
jgi:hypothetical protein